MSLNRHNPKRDENEETLVADLRRLKVAVWRMSGRGLPDLLCGYRGHWFTVEIKTGSGRLTDAQKRFFESADGLGLPAYVVRCNQALGPMLDDLVSRCAVDPTRDSGSRRRAQSKPASSRRKSAPA